MAHHFSSTNQAGLNAGFANLHYLPGRNCFGVSWIKQLDNPFLDPDHRSGSAVDTPYPGPGCSQVVPTRTAAIRSQIIYPGRSHAYVGGRRSAYSLNEVAINWNAPLVLLLAAANSRIVA